jgi:hypothetical protein
MLRLIVFGLNTLRKGFLWLTRRYLLLTVRNEFVSLQSSHGSEICLRLTVPGTRVENEWIQVKVHFEGSARVNGTAFTEGPTLSTLAAT